ncbi:glutamate receptor ionotropic, delta-2 isoform X2 [Cephus cinctus]|uniref:Glutamate receptor ionotropic, delta-2 isoform X2 n=1 Tax=Cephus cinctus TaxID=211228 RepID=A0AAJ7BTG3_CEPCN|nr:glutamate receptor ionotropic, delta-2 isoform X2 [Cephus cinctus]
MRICRFTQSSAVDHLQRMMERLTLFSFLFISLTINNANIVSSARQENLELILDIIAVIQSHNIFLFNGVNGTNNWNTLQWMFRQCSKRGLATAVLTIPKLPEVMQFHYTDFQRPVFVIFLSSILDELELARATKVVNVAFPIWLLLCENDSRLCDPQFHGSNLPNPLGLTFNTEMLMTTPNDGIIFEVYGLEDKAITRKWATWDLGNGLSQLHYNSIYDRRNNLRGTTLVVTIVNDLPFVGYKDGQLEGYFGELMNELSHELNFRMRVYLATDNAYGTWDPETDNWSGMIGYLVNGWAEIGVGGFTITTTRMKDVDFSRGVLSSMDRLFLKISNRATIHWTAYLRIFILEGWNCIGTITLLACAFLTLSRLSRVKSSFFNSLLKNYLRVLRIYCLQGSLDLPRELSNRIAYFVIFLSAWVFNAVYSAFLISIIALPEYNIPFSDMNQFINDNSYKLTVVAKSAEYDLFAISMNQTSRHMWTKMEEDALLPTSLKEAIQKVCNQKIGFYVTDALNSILGDDIPCHIASLESGHKNSLAFGISQNSPYKGLINYQSLFQAPEIRGQGNPEST